MGTARRPVSLSDGITMYTWAAAQDAPSLDNSGEFLVVISSWIGAQPRHLDKYLNGYHQLFPTADILVVECSIRDMAFGTDAGLQSRLAPAQRIIHRHLMEKQGQVVLHAFSNGGAQMAALLAVGLKNKSAPSSFHKLILDCAPGRNDPERTARAITITLPRQYGLRGVATAIFHMMLTLYFSIFWLMRVEDSITYARKKLNDISLFASVPRLYMYSKADQIIDPDDVRRHVAEARVEGIRDVREVVFENSAHCMLLTEDAAKYWKAVEDMLKKDFVGSGQERSKL